MSLTDLFESGSQLRNFTHFSSLVNLAIVDGEISENEQAVLKRLARKLGITDEQVKEAMEKPNAFPINPPHTNMERLERLYDILCLIFADHQMTPKEEELLRKYAVALGFSSEDSQEVIDRSIQILSGRLSFGDYLYLLRRPKSDEED